MGTDRSPVWVAHGPMNLNTFARHAVYYDMDGMAERDCREVERRASDPQGARISIPTADRLQEVRKDIPHVVRDALHDALELALVRVPRRCLDRL